MPFSSGARLGPYEILAAIGRGGMGEVYKARDTRLDRTVAIKFLPAGVSGDPGRRARFEREARALAALNHPNIVTIYAVEGDGDPRFLAMELVDGKTLAQLIPAAGMSLVPLLAIAIPIADALDSAHRHGVVHRDLKPANVMVTSEGRVKLLDFGLARLESEPAGAGEDATFDLLTQAGQVIGTCAYMSPEQAEGCAVDARSDVFSLGTILFEMATGRRPFQGRTELEVLAAVRHEHVPALREIRPALPDAFDRLVARCLEKEPDRRVQTARDVYNELDAIKKAAESAVAVADTRAAGRPDAPERRVAVLPFVNMSADPEQEYFCDGMAEDLINALAHVEGLQVAARTSAFAFKGQNRDVREIGRLLDVGSVLEGSVRRAGDRLRITAQLVRVADGMHLWSERFDRRLDDVFAIQDEISLAIVDRLKVRLLAGEEARVVRRHTADPEAHNLYVKGRYLYGKRSEDDIAQAIECYEGAKAQDPEYPLPYVGLADALVVLAQWSWLHPRDAFPRAKAELERALALDPEMAEANATLGAVATVYDWDWERAERCFTRAISLNPRYGLAHHWYSLFLCIRKRFDEAIRESRAYLDLEPLSPIANVHAGQVLLHAGRMPEAIAQLRKARDLDPRIPLTDVWLAVALVAAGRVDDVVPVSERLLGGSNRLSAFAILTLVAAGRKEEALRQRACLEEIERSRYVGHFTFAVVHAALGEHGASVARLERSYEEREPGLPYMSLFPLGRSWDGVLADPRVRAIMRKMRLPE
jgi:TolB-like protein